MVHEVPSRTTAVVHPDTDEGRRRMRHRRVSSLLTTSLIVLVIGSAVADGFDAAEVWGVDEATVVAVAADGTRLSAVYPTVARPALAAPFEVTIEREGGFDADIELAVDLAYVKLWDLNGIFPSPAEERSEGDRVVWTFDPPEGDVFTVLYEARIEPGVQLETRRGTVSLLDDGKPVLGVRLATKVRP